MGNTNNQKASIYIALISSLLLHLVVVLTVYLLDIPLLIEKKKTIPFQLISNDRRSILSSQQTLSKVDNAKAAQEFLETLNDSSFQRTKKNNNKEKEKTNQPPKGFKPNKNSTFLSAFPRMGTPNQTQSTNANQILQGLRNIFAKKNLIPKQTIIQVSTPSLTNLSDYEVELVQLLAEEKKLYDPFHKIMADNKKERLNYIVNITLFPNGQIKNASIKKSSGIKEIDQLAQQIAYTVSPYPPPPEEDRGKGFKYAIPLNYQLTFSRESP